MTKATTPLALILLLWPFLAAPAVLRADDKPDLEEPPLVGRPDNFSQTVGSYQITSSATPTELCVEDPLLLTVRITGSGPPAYQPQRANLRLFPPDLAQDFYIQDLPDKDRYLESKQTWEFVCQLRPKRLDVAAIPSLKFIYYQPSYKRFQTSYAAAIPLTVKPRPQVQPPAEVARDIQFPEHVYELVSGPQVLRRSPTSWPGLPVLLLLAITPPALCTAWYLLWRRLYPDAVRLARLRRSRAARQALQALRSLHSGDDGRAAAVLTEYLRQRLDYPAAEATPREAARYLLHDGVSDSLSRRVADFFRACDAVRFAPQPPAGREPLAKVAAGLILALEAETCPSPSS